MHQRLARARNVEQRIALRGDFAEPAADQHDQVRRLDAREQLRIDAEADVAGIARMQRVDQMRAAERGRDRHGEALGEARERRASRPPTSGCRRPARSAISRPRAASAASPCRRGPARSRPARTPARRAPRRARPACPRAARSPPGRAGRCRRCRRRATRSRGCAPDRRSRSPISPWCRTPRGSRAPGTPRARASRAPTWPTNTISGVESCLAMWMPGEALVAPGPRVHEHDAGPAGDLADRLRHHGGAALLPADGELDRPVVERVERREIALARHAEHVLHAVHDELVDQNFAAGAGAVIGAQHVVSPCLWRRYIARVAAARALMTPLASASPSLEGQGRAMRAGRG